MNVSIIRRVVEEAKKSIHHHKVGAIIFDKNKIISVAYNVPSRSVKHLHPRFLRWQGSLHAEVHAIIKAKRDIKGMSMLVIRINNNNNFMLAKSCEFCENYLRYVGIKKCYFSTSEGTIQCERL